MTHMFHRWQALWNPERYHGWGRDRQYFEGWYYKAVTADESKALAFIPGISMSADGTEKHAFIQVMHGHANRSEYHRFPFSDFRARPDRFEVSLAQNRFSASQMQLSLPGIRGEVRMSELTPWPKMLGAPGIMGWYSFVPFMECFHGIVSMQHHLTGQLEMEDGPVDFTGGKGYMEKDWGRSFPRAYVWMQSNHFATNREASLMASVAHIPWLGSHFIGFISGFWLDGRLFKFATYTGAKKHLVVGEDEVTLIYQNPREEIRILAHRAEGADLVSPLSGEMRGKINESLQARLEVELLVDGRTVFADVGTSAGLELAGDIRLLYG